jgi:hypothetical protein
LDEFFNFFFYFVNKLIFLFGLSRLLQIKQNQIKQNNKF